MALYAAVLSLYAEFMDFIGREANSLEILLSLQYRECSNVAILTVQVTLARSML
jgi:hypothetical protein